MSKFYDTADLIAAHLLTVEAVKALPIVVDRQKDIASELRKAISERYTRVMDLFKMFDKNGDGRVAKSEFRAALPLLGFDSSYAPVIDNLFDSLDVDGSGSIDHIELNARLRQGADVALDEALQDGARGQTNLRQR